MDVSFDERLGAVSLSGGELWGSGTYTNLLTHGSFEVASGTVEVYRNYALDPNGANPSGISTTAGIGMGHWAGTGNTASVSRNVDAPWSLSGKAYKATWSAVASPESGTIQVSGFKPWATTAGLYTIAVRVKASGVTLPSSKPASISEFGVGASLSAHGNITHSDGTQTLWATVNVTDPATMTTNPRVDWYVSGLTVGAAIEFSMNDAYLGAYQPNRQWFSGSFSPDSDLTAAWTGTTNASASTLTGSKPANVADMAFDQGLHYLSGTTGTRSLCVRVAMGGPVGIPVGNLLPTTGAAYTLSMRVKALTRNTIVTPRIRNTNTSTVTLPKGEWVTIIATGSAGSGSAVQTGLLLGTGAGHQTGDLIQIDWALLVEGALPEGVTYWDGTNKPASIPGATVAWTGSPNASTSTLTIPAINRVTVERDAGQGWQQIRGGNINTITGFYATSDNEMPHHTLVNYRVTGWNNNTKIREFTQTVNTNVTHHNTYIKQAGNPTTTVQVPLTSGPDITSQTQGGTYNILGGNTIAVAAYTGTQADEFTLNARTTSWQESARLDELLKTRILQFVPCAHPIYPAGYYYISNVSKRLRADNTHLEGHEWTLNLTRAAEPSGETAGVAGNTWGRVLATYPTGQDLLDANPTGFDLLKGNY